MTNGSPPSKTESSSAAGGRRRRQSDWRSVAAIVLLAACVGAAVAVYVVGVRNFTTHQKFRNVVEQAAMVAARRLSGVTVEDQVFGPVGLCDLPADEQPLPGKGGQRTIGLNTLYATLRLEALVAQRLRQPVMLELARRDLKRARAVEQELVHRLFEAVQPNPYQTYPAETASIYEQVYQELAAQSAQEGHQLKGLTITLGTVRRPDSTCAIRAAPGQGEGPADYACRGLYRTGRPVPVPGADPVHFFPLAGRVTLVSPAEFDSGLLTVAPSAVLIEADYRPDEGLGTRRRPATPPRIACALTGAPPHVPARSAFLLGFPHGVPPQLHAVSDILLQPAWRNVGQWQQAIGADIPGAGTLGPLAEGEPGEMTPGSALAVALYHWLRYAGPDTEVENLLELINRPFPPAAGAGGPGWQPINSCLARDTGARAFAVLNQTGPQGAGQEAISQAFAWAPRDKALPGSALPLCVDAAGNVDLPGGGEFDPNMVFDFLQALHETNLAGIECRSTARAVLERVRGELVRLDKEISLDAEELASLRQRISRQGQGQASPAVLRQTPLLLKRVAELEGSLSRLNTRRRIGLRAVGLASRLEENGSQAAVRSFQLCSRLGELSGSGLTRSRAQPGAFLLNGRWLFIPHRRPLSEETLLDVASGRLDPRSSGWLDRRFLVLAEAPEAGDAYARPAPPARPLVVVLDSEALKPGRSPRLRTYRRSPFGAVGIPAGELLYYSPNALESGTAIKVGWSVLLRDLVAFRVDRRRGEAQPSSEPDWCRQGDLTEATCPGLACEFQVRSPIPVPPGFQVDWYLTNPFTGEQASLVPPVPPAMI